MKVLHLADLHFNRRWLTWAALRAPAYDVVVVAGDLADVQSSWPYDRQVQWLRQWAHQFPGPLVLSSGTDDIDFSKRSRWLESLRGRNLTVDRGFTRIDAWTFEAVPWFRMPAWGGRRHCAVAHVGPSETEPACIQLEQVEAGDERLRRHLINCCQPPAVLFCGCVHEPLGHFGRCHQTHVLNPGVGSPSADWPNHIEVNLESGAASWHSCGFTSESAQLW